MSKFLNAFTLKRIIAALVGAHEAFFFAEFHAFPFAGSASLYRFWHGHD
ncbi:MAG: hypothetical protein IPN69_09905 [Acidobacteria bacterium]|nr:hypothetical protein [Acidobacteriota bacterium]